MKRSAALPIFSFIALACACAASAQVGDTHASATSKMVWKQYQYPHYGFAISLPNAPKETDFAGGTRFTLYWGSLDSDKAALVNLTVRRQSARRTEIDCASWLADVRENLRKLPPWPLSVLGYQSSNEIIIDGIPAIEGSAPRNGLQSGYQRQECVNGRLYSFEAGFPKDQPRPEVIDRILKSFRLLATETIQ